MNNIQRFFQAFFADHYRNVQFGRALGSCNCTYSISAERSKKIGRYSWCIFHAFTYYSNNGQIALGNKPDFMTQFDFRFKFPFKSRYGIIRIIGIDGKGDGIFRRSLCDKDNVNIVCCQGAEQSHGDALDTYHTRSLNGYKCYVVNG